MDKEKLAIICKTIIRCFKSQSQIDSFCMDELNDLESEIMQEIEGL